MISMIFAAALAAAQAAPVAPANLHAQAGQAQPMDHGKMDHAQMKSDCCKKGADGKMECTMMHKSAGGTAHQDHKGQ